MIIRNNDVDITLPNDGIYFIDNNKCYKLSGKIIDIIYESFITSKTSYKRLLSNYKDVASRCKCTNTCAKSVLSAFYKVYKADYYSNEDNFNWFKSTIIKSNLIDITLYKTIMNGV